MRPGDDEFEGSAIFAQEQPNECGAVCAVNITSILYSNAFEGEEIQQVKVAINPNIDHEGCETSQLLRGLAADPYKVSCEVTKQLAEALAKTSRDCIALVKYKKIAVTLRARTTTMLQCSTMGTK